MGDQRGREPPRLAHTVRTRKASATAPVDRDELRRLIQSSAHRAATVPADDLDQVTVAVSPDALADLARSDLEPEIEAVDESQDSDVVARAHSQIDTVARPVRAPSEIDTIARRVRAPSELDSVVRPAQFPDASAVDEVVDDDDDDEVIELTTPRRSGRWLEIVFAMLAAAWIAAMIAGA